MVYIAPSLFKKERERTGKSLILDRGGRAFATRKKGTTQINQVLKCLDARRVPLRVKSKERSRYESSSGGLARRDLSSSLLLGVSGTSR